MVSKGMMTEEEFKKLTSGNNGHINPELSEWLMGYQKAFTQLLPTPTQRDYKGAPTYRYVGGGVLPTSAPRINGIHSPWNNWSNEPGIPRVVDGIPNRVDRVKALGNAVVPQQFYIFFKLIHDIETGGDFE
jgi:hypothetical protein